MKKYNGFTLIELLIVIIIVGILATVSIPIMNNMRKRAIIAEAVAALGTIRTAERLYFVEHGEYQDVADWIGSYDGWVGSGGRYPVGIKAGDLNGTYFSEGCYRVKVSVGKGSFTVRCYTKIHYNSAPRKDDVLRFVATDGHIIIDTNGRITTNNIPNSGYPED